MSTLPIEKTQFKVNLFHGSILEIHHIDGERANVLNLFKEKRVYKLGQVLEHMSERKIVIILSPLYDPEESKQYLIDILKEYYGE